MTIDYDHSLNVHTPLVTSIVDHADTVLFSAACPDQFGQHPVNCQWPKYWQDLFNGHGFACDESIRWSIWIDSRIEPWYRQNIFFARYNPENAGREKRISPVIHPDMIDLFCLTKNLAHKSPPWKRVIRRLLGRSPRKVS